MTLKLDLHVHSKYSKDGFATVEQLAKRAKEIGLDGFALTDHDTVAGHKEAKRVAKKYNLLIIPGIEIRTKKGDLIGLGVDAPVKRKLSPEETIEKIHRQKGIVIAPHPYGALAHPSGIRYRIKKLNIDAVEVINGRNLVFGNRKALRIAYRKKLPMTAGSDAHLLKELGRVYVKIDAKPNTESIFKAIKEGKTKVYGKPINLFLLLKHMFLLFYRQLRHGRPARPVI